MKEGERYIAGADGTPLYYRWVGTDRSKGGERPALVCCNGIGVSTFFWKYIEEHFSPRHRVVTWDYRGHGRSEAPRNLDDLTMENNARDLAAVMDELGIERAVLLGHSMGVQVIFEFARQEPSRVAALVPMLGTYGHPVETFFDSPRLSRTLYAIGHFFSLRYPEKIQRLNYRLLRSPIAWPAAKALGLVHHRLCPREDLEPYLEHLGALDLRVFFRMAEKMKDHSCEEALPHITAPTLIFAGERDLFTPVWLSQKMAELIPGAELCMIRQGSHAALIEQPELINLRLEKFLREQVGGAMCQDERR